MELKEIQNAVAKSLAPNIIRGQLLQNGEYKFFKTFKIFIKNLLESLSDVSFLLGPNEEQLFAHKLFLMTASPIFHKVLSENHNDVTLTIKIPQISKSTMIEICRYAYTEVPNLSPTNMLDIFHAALKFEMRHLMEKVIEYVAKQVNENSVFSILHENNERYRHWQINKKCFDFIQKHHQKCVKSKNWMKVTPDLMRLILSNCKIPQVSGKEALTAWSKNLGDGFDELEEMMGMISVDNETPSRDEKVKRRKDRGKSRQKVLCLEIQGSLEMPGIYNRAELYIENKSANITLMQLDFIFNLSIANEFFLKIFVLPSYIQIYSEEVKVVANIPYTTHKFNGKCEIRSGQKFFICIEFPQFVMSQSLGNLNYTSGSDLEIIKLLQDMSSSSRTAQIIKKVLYKK